MVKNMSMLTVRRLAADVLNVGMTRIRIDDTVAESKEKLSKAASRDDIKELIKDGVIKSVPVVGQHRTVRNKKRGPGSKKSKRSKRTKKEWMVLVRSQRKLLSSMVANNQLDKKFKKEIYLRIKGSNFRSKGAMLSYMVTKKMIDQSIVDTFAKEKAKRRAEAKTNKKEQINAIKQKRAEKKSANAKSAKKDTKKDAKKDAKKKDNSVATKNKV